MRSFNISQNEINYNGAVVIFEIGNEQTKNQNLRKLLSILRNNGLEILAAEHKKLDAQEALFFKIRQLYA